LLQVAKLATIGKEDQPVAVTRNSAQVDLTLPRQGVALLVVSPGAD
jgi:hypothetical protein